MFMTSAALESLQNSSGWNAEATVIDQGKGADVDAVVAASPVIAYVFGKGGLIGAFSLDGARITRM